MNTSRKFDKLELGYWSGIASMIITVTMIVVAYAFSPDYKPLVETISKLGIRPVGQYPFIFGTALGGLLLIVHHYYFTYDLAKKDKNIYYGRLAGIFSGIGIIGVGVVQDKPDIFFQVTHLLLSVVFFSGMAISIYFFGQYLQLRSTGTWDIRLFKLSLVVIGMAILHFFISFLKGIIDLGIVQFSPSVLWQKLTVGSFIIWYIIFIVYGNMKSKGN